MGDVREWKAELTKLTQLGDRYEVGLTATVKRNDEFSRESSATERSVEEAMASVSRKLRSFRNGLSAIQQRLHDFTHASSNIEGIQGVLENFEGKISAYKRNMREEFGSMIEEENMYTRDCDAMLRRIDEWADDEPRPPAPKSPSRRAKQAGIKERYDKDMARQAKIGGIDRELALIGGRTGGWEPGEHDIFLKVWTQTVTARPVSKAQRNTLMRRVTPLLPNRTADEVDEHGIFYSNYLDLTGEKKRVLSAWKEARVINARQEVAAGQAALEQPPVDALPLPGSPRRGYDAEKVQSTKQQIAKWREDKAAKLLEDKAAEARSLAERRKEEADERVFLRNSNKMRIEQWRQQELEKAARLASAKEVATRPKSVDPSELARRRERDEEMLARQKEKREGAAAKKTARERRLRELEAHHEFKTDVPITRDTDRLLAPTTTFESSRITPQQRQEAAERRKNTSAHDSYSAGTGRDLAYGGKARAGWMAGAF